METIQTLYICAQKGQSLLTNESDWKLVYPRMQKFLNERAARSQENKWEVKKHYIGDVKKFIMFITDKADIALGNSRTNLLLFIWHGNRDMSASVFSELIKDYVTLLEQQDKFMSEASQTSKKMSPGEVKAGYH